MAQAFTLELIGVGAAPDDGTGDLARDAFIKANAGLEALNEVIEYGSNGNGEYVRFADGTQICTKIYLESSLAVTTAAGNLFRSGPISWTFPAEFVGINSYATHGQASAAGTDYLWLGRHGTLLAASTEFMVYGATSVTPDVRLAFTAIGRWK